jgi:hypothetical protein
MVKIVLHSSSLGFGQHSSSSQVTALLEILRVNIIIGYVRHLLWLLFTLECISIKMLVHKVPDPASSPSVMKNERCSNSTAVLKSREPLGHFIWKRIEYMRTLRHS